MKAQVETGEERNVPGSAAGVEQRLPSGDFGRQRPGNGRGNRRSTGRVQGEVPGKSIPVTDLAGKRWFLTD